MDIQTVKQRFGINGTSEALNRALEIALRVAPTDLSVLVSGESGVGKEFFPQIIHAYSARRHNKYIAVNCGAIPEGTIDSELFGHEKGAFTGATESRKGYFEEANGGTIFLDEVAELPLSTQVRLLRVLQTGEFIRVGSSRTLKTDVRVVAATNKDVQNAVTGGRFREDLYYRLNTVPIHVPALRERKGDIHLLFRRFAADIASQYRMPPISLDEQARRVLENYSWPGNIRQLKNVAEQISAIEETRLITAPILERYLPRVETAPVLFPQPEGRLDMSDRDLLYKVLFDMRNDVNELKRMLVDAMQLQRQSEPVSTPMHTSAAVTASTAVPVSTSIPASIPASAPISGYLPAQSSYQQGTYQQSSYGQSQYGQNAYPQNTYPQNTFPQPASGGAIAPTPEPEDAESEDITNFNPLAGLTKEQAQREAIVKALRRHGGKRKEAARELFMSERTLYRKIKDLNINDI